MKGILSVYLWDFLCIVPHITKKHKKIYKILFLEDDIELNKVSFSFKRGVGFN